MSRYDWAGLIIGAVALALVVAFWYAASQFGTMIW